MPTPAPRRLLVVRVDRLGDLLTTTPALRSLWTGYPEAQIDLLASDDVGSDARNISVSAVHPVLDEMLTGGGEPGSSCALPDGPM